MGKVGKISTIKKEYNKNNGSVQAALAQNGYQRFPGAFIRISPYFDLNSGKYWTGLDDEAAYIDELSPEDQKIERQRVRELKEKLERKTQLNLDPQKTPDCFYDTNSTAYTKAHQIKLIEGDNIFNLDNPLEEIAWHWLKKHPFVAPSMEAYERGDCFSTVQFYVHDEEIEADREFKKKSLINRAIATLESMSVDKQVKIGRLLGLPVNESTKPMIVYNQLDTYIKAAEIKSEEYKGEVPVEIFMKISSLDDRLLTTKDLIKQAIKLNILRKKGDKLFDGEVPVASSELEYVAELLDDDNQADLLALKEKLRQKKFK